MSLSGFKKFLEINQQKLAIIIGYTLVFGLAFALGRITILTSHPPELRLEEPQTAAQANTSAEIQGLQSQAADPRVERSKNLDTGQLFSTGFAPNNGGCNGKIKGSSSKIYHLPNGAFYDRTTKPVICFETENEARAAGFRQSAR